MEKKLAAVITQEIITISNLHSDVFTLCSSWKVFIGCYSGYIACYSAVGKTEMSIRSHFAASIYL